MCHMRLLVLVEKFIIGPMLLSLTSFLDEVVDGLLRLFILLQNIRIDSNFLEHVQEDRVFAQILHIYRLK